MESRNRNGIIPKAFSRYATMHAASTLLITAVSTFFFVTTISIPVTDEKTEGVK